MSLAASADGRLIAAAWNAYDATESEERPFVVSSKDGGESFGSPLLLPNSALFAYPHIAVAESRELLVAGVRYEIPDSGTPDFRGVIETYHSSEKGKKFTQLGRVSGSDFAREQSALAASPDGKVVVVAWVDSVSAMLAPELRASPAGALWAAISTDGGASFATPQVISSAPAIVAGGRAQRPQLFVREGRAGVLFLESIEHPPLVPKVPAAFLKLADRDGHFGPARRVDDDAHGVLAGQPGVAVGLDGTIHVAWLSREPERVGLWRAVSNDGATFSTPVSLYPELAGDGGLSIEVAVDGSGTEWVGFIDRDARLQLARTPKGAPSSLLQRLTERVSVTDEYLDLAPLVGDGVWLLWAGAGEAAPDADAGATQRTDIKLMRIAPED